MQGKAFVNFPYQSFAISTVAYHLWVPSAFQSTIPNDVGPGSLSSMYRAPQLISRLRAYSKRFLYFLPWCTALVRNIEDVVVRCLSLLSCSWFLSIFRHRGCRQWRHWRIVVHFSIIFLLLLFLASWRKWRVNPFQFLYCCLHFSCRHPGWGPRFATGNVPDVITITVIVVVVFEDLMLIAVFIDFIMMFPLMRLVL